LRLGLLDELDGNFGEEGTIAVKGFWRKLGITMIEEMGLDHTFKISFCRAISF